jgi:hypothetical protein
LLLRNDPKYIIYHLFYKILYTFVYYTTAGGEVPSIKAYDAYVKECVVPFAEICDDLGGLGTTLGTSIQNAWEGVRYVIVLASRAKAPVANDYATILNEQLKRTQDAVQSIRSIKFEREYDRHYKAICEMLSCLSWVFYTAPKQLPTGFVRETLASAEFWLNRIRKDFKGKDERHIQFCDRMKNVQMGLEKYISEYHKTGLTFNPRGVSIAEAVIVLSDEPTDGSKLDEHAMKSPKTTKRHPTMGTTATAGVNITGIMGELSKRKSTDGSSAATGLKHVRIFIPIVSCCASTFYFIHRKIISIVIVNFANLYVYFSLIYFSNTLNRLRKINRRGVRNIRKKMVLATLQASNL